MTAIDSTARAILVWRDSEKQLPAAKASRLKNLLRSAWG